MYIYIFVWVNSEHLSMNACRDSVETHKENLHQTAPVVPGQDVGSNINSLKLTLGEDILLLYIYIYGYISICMYKHLDVFVYLDIHIYIYIQQHRGPESSCPKRGNIPGAGMTFFDFGDRFIEKSAGSSRSCDGP